MSRTERPSKRAKLLENDSDSESDISDQGAQTNGFKINTEYARRFEHNKKREEKQQLEEKFGSSGTAKRRHGEEEDEDNSDEDDSTDESEDDDADLATADVDNEIFATLRAIKEKDPRVYDKQSKFYKEFDPEVTSAPGKKSDKPMYLQDYHRENLLSGYVGSMEEDAGQIAPTYQQEQDALKRDVVRAMHTTAEDDEDDDGFLVAKSRTRPDPVPAAKPKRITEEDVKVADRDPETYLSNFMAARAWLPNEGARAPAFESDDSEEDARADEVEEAYNLRFENPNMANEKLRSFARDVGKYGVRREEKSSRQKAREREQEKKAAAKQERQEERARLRKLRIEEAEEKVKRIKEAAGFDGQELDLDQWRDVIEGDFDDDRWEQEMKRRFGEDYYAEQDAGAVPDEEEAQGKKRHSKKPKWDDDIDINDLIPDFESGEQPAITLSSDEDGEASEAESSRTKAKTKKDRLKDKADAKRTARKERQKIEEMVDISMPLDLITAATASSEAHATTGFRYRATSPTAFGLTARDILFADDAQLNQFAGLKKMAAYRDEDKKQRDRKKLSKKARLKQWRKETFGSADEPSGGFERVLGVEAAGAGEQAGEAGHKKKRKRSKKTKGSVKAE